MSKFSSYDDLPLDVAYKLQCLEFELQEGDITQKGYEKKKNSILAPYQALLEEKNSFRPSQPVVQKELEEESVETPIDFGPEPSAADVVDFLDFLPSPSHSPVDTKGATLMEENHNQQTPKIQPTVSSPSSIHTNIRQPSLPPLPPRSRQVQQQFRPPPSNFMPENYIRPSVQQQQQQQNWNQSNTRPFDPRMGLSRPIYGNGYPMRSPMGFRPSPPPPPSSVSPSIYNRPPPQPFNAFRPPPSSINAPIPSYINGSLSQQHSRSPSLDSKGDYGIPYGIRQSLDVVSAPESVDWGKKN